MQVVPNQERVRELLTFLDRIDWKRPGFPTKSIAEENPLRKIYCKISDIKRELDEEMDRIRRDQHNFKRLVDNSPDFIAELDRDLNILSMNLPMANSLGDDVVSLIGKNILGLYSGDAFRERSEMIRQSLEKQVTIRNETERNGLYFENIYLPSSEHQTVQIIIRDITARKRVELEKKDIEMKMLAQSKLATLGEVATGVAHEINQPLTFISSVIQLLLEELDANDLNLKLAQERLEKSENQIEKITDIINHLKTLGRRKIESGQRVDLNKVLYDSLLIVNERIRLRDIHLVCDTDPQLKEINGSPNQLEQIFLNMFSNAIDALENQEEGKEIRVETRNETDGDVAEVLLSFSDNGSGMTEEVRQRIFEPFYTTKDVGRGTGLGLSIILGIIEEHQGRISCVSNENDGTRFTIRFPVCYQGGENGAGIKN